MGDFERHEGDDPPPGSVPAWRSAPDHLALADDEVHVWRVWLDDLASRTSDLYPALTPDERERARRFVFDRDRTRFVAGRWSLRSVLARYLGRAPERLRFEYSPYGKPRLVEPSQAPISDFSVTETTTTKLREPVADPSPRDAN